ncbi:MAG TPA: PilZ domain-containing protein [Phycisphaerae bacterium]|nr:PilZ domain-containing protein [Phycisphaerae bacterium]HOI55538.1 PilZ domain-containing protein [Phycisphaerae bacterium]
MIKTDSRKHQRIKCRVIVEHVGPTVDLSAGGIRVLMANPITEGTEVRLAFQLPESEELVQCHGRVAYVDQSQIDAELREVGIQFLRMMARHRQAIAEYVDGRADDPAHADQAADA